MIVGINAININSGGGIQHIVELTKNILKKNKNAKIVIWAESKISNVLESNKNLKVINISYGYLINFFWKIFFLNHQIIKEKCDLMFFPDGIIIKSPPVKSVILFQNLIPFNLVEIIK